MKECPNCDGAGEIETGGVTPWGTWVTEQCAACSGTGQVPSAEYEDVIENQNQNE